MTTATHCPCCASGDLRVRWKDFLRCGACGFLTVRASYSDEQLGELYQGDYFRGGAYADYLGDKEIRLKTLREHLALVKAHVAPGGRILEIGCAHGLFLDLIQTEFPGSMGIDVSREAVACAQGRGLDVRVGSAEAISGAGPFDAVCLWDTIEHLGDPLDTIQKVHGLLEPGGHLFVTTGDLGAWLPRVRGRHWRQIRPPLHLHYFTRPALAGLCRRTGFEVAAFGTVTEYWRMGSALRQAGHPSRRGPSALAARLVLRLLPRAWQDAAIPLRLGDTMSLVARKGD